MGMRQPPAAKPEVSPYALTEQFGIPPMIETPEFAGMYEWAAEDPEDFWDAIREVGPGESTNDILRSLWPEITDEQGQFGGFSGAGSY